MTLVNLCPRHDKRTSPGVPPSVEGMADRLEGCKPLGAIPFKRLPPLYEAISYAACVNRLCFESVIDAIRAVKENRVHVAPGYGSTGNPPWSTDERAVIKIHIRICTPSARVRLDN